MTKVLIYQVTPVSEGLKYMKFITKHKLFTYYVISINYFIISLYR